MIRYTEGNLLEDPAEALVNTVNEVGVMGKGIALMFREQFPDNAEAYERACAAKEVRVGQMFVTHSRVLWGPRWIINFPTKKHWRHPSKIEWVREGLKDMVRVIRENGIQSVALPPLGCGNGGLEWNRVRREIETALADVPEVDVVVYVPTSKYLNAPKSKGVESLTPARALVADLVRRYSIPGLECTVLEVQKLAWFLTSAILRAGLPDPLDLRFTAHTYGPYADRLRHLLNTLDGSYLHCEKRLSDAKPLTQIWFEDERREQVKDFLHSEHARAYLGVLEEASAVIEGFQSPLGMELLATVDWLLSEVGVATTVPAVRAALAKWPGGQAAAQRKLRLFDDRLVGLAVHRLAPRYPTNRE